MSIDPRLIDTLTIDEFAMLDPADHAVAIHLYSQRITQLERWLRPGLAVTGNEEALADELRRCQNFRKIHVHRMHEQLWLDPAEVLAEQEADGSTAVAA